MAVRSDVTQVGPLEIIEMFILDTSTIGGGANGVFHFHPGNNPFGNTPIIWKGVQYEPFPVETTGWEANAAGKLPRPTIRVSNIGGYMGSFIRPLRDGLGARLTRKRTLGKYLDAINFPDGNPYANPNTAFPDEIFYVARKVVENPIFLEMELAVAFDVEGVLLPRRQVLAGICPWIYRSPECTYAGPPVQDEDGDPTSDPTKDVCRKTLDACRARFGATGILRFGGFPSSMLGQHN